jgi:ATP-binding cassette, subfamily C, bacteriocin exporter
MKPGKFVCIRQNDITDCGPACLASVGMHYGVKIPVIKIREMAGTDKKGTNVLGMIRAAEKMGFSAKGVRGTVESLYSIPLPVIAHVVIDNALHHYLVIYRIRKNSVTTADPARGIRKTPLDDFRKIWDGVMILLEPNGSVEKPAREEDSNFRRISRLIWPEKKAFGLGIAAASAYTVLSLFTAFYIKKIIDDILPNSNLRLLRALGLAMFGIILLKIVLNAVRQNLQVRISQRLDTKLILGYYNHILGLPQGYFDTRHVGEIVARVNDAVKIRYAVGNVSVTLVVDSMIVILSMIVIVVYSVKLSFFPLSFIFINVMLVWILYERTRQTQMSIMVKSAELQSQMVSSVHAASTIRSLLAKEYNGLITGSIFSGILRLLLQSNRQQLAVQSVAEASGSFAVVGILWYGGSLVIRSHMSMGDLILIYTLIGFLIAPVERLLSLQQVVQDALVAGERLFEVMTLDTEEKVHPGEFILSREKIRGEIVFADCTFQYGFRKTVLSDFNLVIPPGQITVITGKSGSGKSTLFKLLHRYYDLNEGRILLDGRNILEIKTQSLRSSIGLVLQETELFPMTVLENIAYGDTHPDMRRVNAVSTRLGIDRFIEELPHQYQTLIGERGFSLSGGQKQMLSIARVLYRNPKIFLLDEPTNSIDAEYEIFLRNTIFDLKSRNCTIVIISHRLDAIHIADKVVFMDKGAVKELKKHDERLFLQQTQL